MRGVFVLCILLLVLSGANSQQNIIQTHNIAKPDADTVESGIFWCILEIEPVTPKDWRRYLEKNLELDSLSVDTIPAGCYTVCTRLVIDEKGKISMIVEKDPGYGLGQRVQKVIESYKGKWKPAQMNGRSVKAYRKQDITFIVEEEKEECKGSIPKEFIL